MPDNQSAVPVSQRAREAAASIWRWRGDYSTANDTAAGRADNSNFVKTFAAFESECAAEVEALRAENARLREAVTASGETKHAYIGEFSWTEWVDGQGYERVVPWAVIKQIMGAILDRAGVEPLNDDADIEDALNDATDQEAE